MSIVRIAKMSAVWGASKSWTSHFNASDSSTNASNEVNGKTTGVVFTERASASKSSPVKAASLKPSPSLSKIRRSRGVVYGELEPVPLDPNVDPDWDLCFNCWKSGHSHKECKYPKYHDYCRNCGRRGVNWTSCPRCAKGYREYQQWRLDNNRPEYKERVKPIVSKQVVENSGKDNYVPPDSLMELPASKVTSENEFKIAQAEFPAIKSISTSSAPSGNEDTITQSRFTVTNSLPASKALFGSEFKMAQSEFPAIKSIPANTVPVANECTFDQSEFPVSNSFPNNVSSFEYTTVQSGFSASNFFQTSNAAFGNEYNIVQSGYPVSKFFPASRPPFGNEFITSQMGFSVANSFSTSGNEMENAKFAAQMSTTNSENVMRQNGLSKPIVPPPLQNAAGEMNINTVTHSKPNAAFYQNTIREIIIQNECTNQSIDNKQNKSNSLGESLISSEEGDYIIDEDLDGIIVDEEETDSTEPCARNTVQDFLSLIDVVKHLPITTQNKIVEQFAKERRELTVGNEMEKLKNRFH